MSRGTHYPDDHINFCKEKEDRGSENSYFLNNNLTISIFLLGTALEPEPIHNPLFHHTTIPIALAVLKLISIQACKYI